MQDIQTVSLENGTTIEVVQDAGLYSGLGKVSQSGISLRSSRRPISAEIRTPDGVRMVNPRLIGVRQNVNEATIEIGFDAQHGGPMDWMLHEVRPRVNTTDWSLPPQRLENTQLSLILRPVTREVGEHVCTGFSYQYRYTSDEHSIYKITDRATWEIGGRAVGNEFYLRNAFAPSIFPIHACTQSYSTEWYLPSAMNSSIFQFLPWQTGLEGFCMTCHQDANLVIWASRVAHIRSLFEKQAGCDEMIHWHEHCGDLSPAFETAPIEVLCIPGGLDRVGRLNLYHAIREMVADELHQDAGMRRERVTSYGAIEDWGPADLARYTTHGLPKLLDAGVKTIMLVNQFQNNMNVFGVSNICCTVDYVVPQGIGVDHLSAFCDAAGQRGACIEMWGNTAISNFGLKAWQYSAPSKHLTPLPVEGSVMEMLRGARDPFVRNPAGHTESDHYNPEFAQLNLRDPDVRAYWLMRWKEAHDVIGLRGIFLDSSFNLSSDKFHWIANTRALPGASATPDQSDLFGFARPERDLNRAVLSQYEAHLSLMAMMQELGYTYCAEDIGVFGIHRSGGNPRDQLTNLSLWADCLCEFNGVKIESFGFDPNDVYFRGLAYRQVWRLFWNVNHDLLSWSTNDDECALHAPTPWQLDLIRVFNDVEQSMRDRTILPDEQGVVYRSGRESILWAFRDFTYDMQETCDVFDVTAHRCVDKNRLLNIDKHHVYRIRSMPLSDHAE